MAASVALILAGLLLAVALGFKKVSESWVPTAEYALQMTAVFVAVAIALIANDRYNADNDRSKALRYLDVIAIDLSRSKQSAYFVFARWEEYCSVWEEPCGPDDYVEENPRHLPTLSRTILESDAALTLLHPLSVMHIRNHIDNLEQYHRMFHDDLLTSESVESDVETYIRMVGAVEAALSHEMDFQRGEITEDQLASNLQSVVFGLTGIAPTASDELSNLGILP